MSAIRKKEGKETPAISTASLPDIIFILLFFFMVATVMRETELKVKFKPPKATELQKLERRSLVSYIHVGPPQNQEKFGAAPRVQLNDVLFNKEDAIREIPNFIKNERHPVDEKLINQMTVSLRVDANTKMGLLSDIKQELRKANALKINYSAVPPVDIR